MSNDFTEVRVKDKTYQIRKYGENENFTLESLSLIANARELFFGIAEDGISVPSNLTDEATGKIIYDKRRIAELAIFSREALYKITGHDKFAAAKLAGAYVNMIELLADETLAFHYAGDKARYDERRHAMGDYYKKVQALIPNINLKGRKADVDGVMLALLGEVPKAAILKNEVVHNYEYINTATAMYEVDHVTEWMKGIVRQTPAFASMSDSIHHFGEVAKERLNLRREDLSSRDAFEVDVRRTARTLREKINSAAKHDRRLHAHAEDLLRGIDIIGEMLKQGAKPVSISLLTGIRQVDEVNELLRKTLSTLPPAATTAPRKALRELHNATKTHMLNMLQHGVPREYFATEFSSSLSAASRATFDVPDIIARQAKPAIGLYLNGIERMGRIPPDLTRAKEEIIAARVAVTNEIGAFAAQAQALISSHRK